LTNPSAFCLSAASFGSSFVEPNGHGVASEPSAATAVETPPCMSWHWLGVIQTKFGVVDSFCRSVASAVSGLSSAIRPALFRMSEKRTNGLCFEA
jgi:hypothetical protein